MSHHNLPLKEKKKTIYGHSLKNHMRWDKTINILKDTDRQTIKKVNMVWTEQQCVWLRAQIELLLAAHYSFSWTHGSNTHIYTHSHTHTHICTYEMIFFFLHLQLKGFFFCIQNNEIVESFWCLFPLKLIFYTLIYSDLRQGWWHQKLPSGHMQWSAAHCSCFRDKLN